MVRPAGGGGGVDVDVGEDVDVDVNMDRDMKDGGTTSSLSPAAPTYDTTP